MRWGLYVHIPFCKSKCGYCDFASYVGKDEEMGRYVKALLSEMEVRGRTCWEKWGAPQTIYFGGGTPTLLSADLLARIFEGLFTVFEGTRSPEITIEANPGTVEKEKLTLLHQLGVNRMSFGVQSFDDEILKALGRIHTAQEAKRSIQMAQETGFSNISLDLMYGLPAQGMADLRQSVDAACALGVQHISIYGLQIEEGTPFAEHQQAGMLDLPDEDVVEEMYDFITEELPRRGYARYEISNFAKHAFESRHNQGYWQDVPYLGIGAAAHSYLDGMRFHNPASLANYCAAVEACGRAETLAEEPSREIAMEEFAFLGLRTREGVDEEKFFQKFGMTFTAIYGEQIERLSAERLLRREHGFCALTQEGMKIGNRVFMEFLL